MMSGIRGKDTKPEMVLRRALHARGFRYRLHDRHLPGRPDLVFPRFRAAIFVNGCFWHGHDCHLFRLPATRPEFWEAKIASNRLRDAQAESELLQSGWRVLKVWECALKGRTSRPPEWIIDTVSAWIAGRELLHEVRGTDGWR
jgi:DNA mismatch endonuclease (patch repair protein)